MFRMREKSLRRNCRSRLRKTILALLAAGMAAVSGPAYAKGVRIGVILPTQQHIRFAFEARLLEETAKVNSDEAIVQYSMENAATQKNQVETMIARGIDVLIMSATEAFTHSAKNYEARPEFRLLKPDYLE